MSEIKRHEVNEEWAYSGIVEAGGFVFLSFCEGNVGQSVEAQVNGALDDMCRRLELAGLSLDAVVKMGPYERPVEYSHYGEGVPGTFSRQISGQEDHCHRVCEQRRRKRPSNTNRRNRL